MTNKKSKTKSNNKLVSRNPAHTLVARQPRPKMSFDGTLMKGTNISGNIGVTGNLAGGTFTLSCSSNASVASSLVNMLKFYKEYKYISATAEWLPFIGPGQAGAGSRVYCAYLDSPEMIVSFDGAAVASKVLQVKGIRDMKSFNAWERYSYSIPLTYRKKWFDVDSTAPGYTEEVLDRVNQGAFIYGIDGINASETLGAWRFLFTVQVNGLTTVLQA